MIMDRSYKHAAAVPLEESVKHAAPEDFKNLVQSKARQTERETLK